MALPDTMPAKRPDVLTAAFDTELVVLVPEEQTAHRLDEGLSLALDSCDGVTPTADVIAEVASVTVQPDDAVARWLEDALDQLRQLGVFAEG